MWKYDFVTREEFESLKNKIEDIIVTLGAKSVYIQLSYPSNRQLFEFNYEYYRVDEIFFETKPFVVIECGSYDESANNVMEDTNPFPYDLSDDELINEVKYALGIIPYPQ